jgi:hypothetical protein
MANTTINTTINNTNPNKTNKTTNPNKTNKTTKTNKINNINNPNNPNNINSSNKSNTGRLARVSGYEAESAACAWLESQGLVIVARNVRYCFGELDIVAWHGNVLVHGLVQQRIVLLLPSKNGYYEPQQPILHNFQKHR